MEALFVFSHLRWDFVFQRPQQLMSRLARHYRIFFIEEPVTGRHADTVWQASDPLPQLTVLRPQLPPGASAGRWHVSGPMLETLARLARAYPRHLAWLYTPMAMPLLTALDPSGVVYDCMDELSAFLHSPPDLLEQEQALFARADRVFAGGPSLFEAKRHFHRHVYCFPSSVDVTHFRQALDRNIAHPAYRRLPGPKLGFFGVLDERFDGELVAAVADREPNWQIVLAGPVAKIDPASLPRRPNIHYAGQQPYAALPALLACWDVCLLPFALNEATRFISPTKSLEYMAAELPVVSTAVPDVVSQHADVIAIVHSPAEFADRCRQALALPAAERQRMLRRMRAKLAATSWDATAEAMRQLLCSLTSERARAELGDAG